MSCHPAFLSDPLMLRDTFGHEHPIQADTVIEAALKVLNSQMRQAPCLSTPMRAKEFIRLKLGLLEHEVFAVIHLDVRQTFIDYVEMFRGTLRRTSVYPREVLKDAMAHNSAAIIMAHNHPSGAPIPSEADIELTELLQSTLRLVDVTVLDHLIVTKSHVVSMAEMGLLQGTVRPTKTHTDTTSTISLPSCST